MFEQDVDIGLDLFTHTTGLKEVLEASLAEFFHKNKAKITIFSHLNKKITKAFIDAA